MEASSTPNLLSSKLFAAIIGVILFSSLFFGLSALISAKLIRVGDQMFPGYFLLKSGISKPDCERNPNIDQEVQKLKNKQQTEQQDDPFGLSTTPPSDESLRRSVEASVHLCQQKWMLYERAQQKRSPLLDVVFKVDAFFSYLTRLSMTAPKALMLMFLFLGSFGAGLGHYHLSLRPIRFRRDQLFADGSLVLANLLLVISTVAHRRIEQLSGSADLFYFNFWIAGFVILLILSLVQFMRSHEHLPRGGSLGHALLSIPIYAYMTFFAFIYFMGVLWVETGAPFYAGPAIRIRAIDDLSHLFLNVAVYGWIGMLLMQSKLPTLIFSLVRRLRLPTEVFASLVLLIFAVPTAYSGASGIFIIAAGALLYRELRKTGATASFALATTAMSGSTGVVLHPCLLVVIIAFLNREVTTDQLFSNGIYVFLLSNALFLLYAWLLRDRNRSSKTIHVVSETPLSKDLLSLIPYVIIGAIVVAFFRFVLDRQFDENSASLIGGFIILFVVLYDHRRGGFWRSMYGATLDTARHAGALLMLMVLSLCLSGVVQYGRFMEHILPMGITSPWAAMAIIMPLLVLVAMLVDPYGAVILVSTSFAPWALASGLNAVHFWLVVLTAFELGYLMPPIMLNHLLTRHVVGDNAVREANAEKLPLFSPRGRFLLPILVMGTTMILVSFGPLLLHGR
jgi:TRAP-type C4-dicarboxylate transport system permease large subunit